MENVDKHTHANLNWLFKNDYNMLKFFSCSIRDVLFKQMQPFVLIIPNAKTFFVFARFQSIPCGFYSLSSHAIEFREGQMVLGLLLFVVRI
jgi:hypothetical protein